MASSAMDDNAGGGSGGSERAKYLGFNTIAPDEGEKETSLPAGSPKHFKKSSSITTTASIETFNIEIPQDHDVLEKKGIVERSQWVLDGPKPPGLFREVVDSVRDTVYSMKNKYYSSLKGQSFTKRVISIQQEIFPILVWIRNYSATKFKNDLMAGLTIASLCIPQVIFN